MGFHGRGEKRTKKNIVRIGIAIFLLGILTFGFIQIKILKTEIIQLQWADDVMSKNEEDTFNLQVGVIQFLRRGYSIHIKNLKYSADGLTIEGILGNPLNITLHNVTIKLSATKNLWEYRKEWEKSRSSEFSFIYDEPIGIGQSSVIAMLLPGGIAPFEVTIPNVKQTKEGIRIVVSFTGERYSY